MNKTIWTLVGVVAVIWLSSCGLNNGDVKVDNTEEGKAAVQPSEPVANPADNQAQPSQQTVQTKINTSEKLTFSPVTDLKKEILSLWDWAEAVSWDILTVNYYWRLVDWTVFDTSLQRWQPFTFKLWVRQVIEWWDEWIQWMKEGEVRRLQIPASKAYQDRAVASIPANSTLIFDVELIKVAKDPTAWGQPQAAGQPDTKAEWTWIDAQVQPEKPVSVSWAEKSDSPAWKAVATGSNMWVE